jgi:sortase (surface protein transpeptidase)
LLVGLGLIIYALLHFFDWYTHTQGTAVAPNPSHVVTVSTDKPDEKPVPSGATYNVPADQPKKILIPSIGAEGFIQQVGEDQHKEISTPSNTNYAGWFVGSVKPGDKGLSIIDGHVSSRYGRALFAKVKNLQQGETVTIQFGDDSLRHFEVVERRELPKNEIMPYLLKKHDDIDSQLNLITCGGTFDKSSQQYANRVVVVTKRTN